MSLTKEQSSALKRNLAAVQRVIFNIRAHDKIFEADTVHPGIDFIQLAYRALFNDAALQSMNVFEGKNGGKARSFWWLYKQKQKEVDEFVKCKKLNWSLLEEVSEKLKDIRNGTHAHFSHQYADDYKRVWEAAGLKGDDWLKALDIVWEVLAYLQGDDHLPSLDYDGEDAKEATKFISALCTGKNL